MNNTIKKHLKEYALLIISVGALITVSALSLKETSHMQKVGNAIYQTNLKGVKLTSDLQFLFERQIGLISSVPAIYDLEQIEEIEKTFSKNNKNIIEMAESSAHFSHVIPDIQKLKKDSSKVFEYGKNFAQDQASTHIETVLKPEFKIIENALAELSEDMLNNAKENTLALSNSATLLSREILIITPVLLIFVMLFGYINARTRIKRQTETAEILQQVITVLDDVNIVSEDIMSQSEKLNIEAVDTSAKAKEVNTISQNTSEHIHTISSAIEELSSTAISIDNDSKETLSVSQHALETSLSAKQLGKDMDDALAKINSVLAIIVSIADQTNLLALNAAIESARAGEAGRGFAVVADEVRKLAGETAKATQEISERINDINHSSSGVFKAIDSTNDAIENILITVEKICESMHEQSSVTANVAENISDITEQSENISSEMNNINVATSSVKNVSSDNINISKELVSKSHELTDKLTEFMEIRKNR